MLLAYPQKIIALFATSLIILHKTASTNQRTSSPQPLLCEVEADKIHCKIFINSLESGEELGVI